MLQYSVHNTYTWSILYPKSNIESGVETSAGEDMEGVKRKRRDMQERMTFYIDRHWRRMVMRSCEDLITNLAISLNVWFFSSFLYLFYYLFFNASVLIPFKDMSFLYLKEPHQCPPSRFCIFFYLNINCVILLLFLTIKRYDMKVNKYVEVLSLCMSLPPPF